MNDIAELSRSLSKRLPLIAGHPLTGAYEKFWQAQRHYDELQASIHKLAEEGFKPAEFVAGFRPRSKQTYRLVVSRVREPPLQFAVVVGDIVHNLRSSLDHLIFELSFVGSRGKIPSRRVAYPCCRTRQEWESKHVQEQMLAGIDSRHKRLIYRTQPCYRRRTTGPAAKRHWLDDLERLWIHDKHRVLQILNLAPTGLDVSIAAAGDCIVIGQPRLAPGFLGKPFLVGAEVTSVRIEPTGPDPFVEFDYQVATKLGFKNGLYVDKALDTMSAWVLYLLDTLAPSFETGAARKLWGVSREAWLDTAPWIRSRTLRVR